MHKDFNELNKAIEKSDLKLDLDLIKKAYIIANKFHKGQKRKSGEDYISHPLAVAKTLVEVGADQESIIAAILHDTVEDTDLSLGEIELQFGKEVKLLVDGLTKISKHDFRKVENLSVKIESLRKWLEVMQKDIRAGIIKLFDRLHNMQTIDALPNPEKRQRIAKETLDIYTKIAKKLAMNKIKKELENLSLRCIDYENFIILKKIQENELNETAVIFEYINKILLAADYENKILNIEHEPIYIWEMYKNEIHKKDELKGIIKIRIIITTKNIQSCYYVLFLIHSLWKIKRGFFKDTISTPSPNGCKELSTTILFDNGENIQFIIRTKEMYEYYNFGITRFCFSKPRNERSILWLRNLSHITRMELSHSYNFLLGLQNDILGKSIVIYSEFDEPFLLPSYSTALDAAFYIHKEKAFKLNKVCINGIESNFSTQIKESNHIHFSFSKKNTVDKSWLNKRKTALAYSLIKQSFKSRK